ncbi:MAG TPA: phosphatase PAP2 family protein [Candidatus Cloacimonadota bacterium]|nr:phosphatase PAP2 family protein [Candidatus Cloacimonadota bacterium]
MPKLFIIILLALAIVGTMHAGETSFTQQYLRSYPHSVCQGLQEPLSWETGQWLTAGGVLLGFTALYLADEEIKDFTQKNRSENSGKIMTAAKQFGEGIYVLPAIGLTIAGGLITDSPKTTDTGLLSLKSSILAQGVTQSFKLISQRKRPSADAGKEFFHSWKRKNDSFPSGHSTIVWSIAPILADQYRDSKWVAPTVYSIATLTSISRVHDNSHWASDVFTGAAIGYYTARLVLADTPRLLQIYPSPAINGIGLSYSF